MTRIGRIDTDKAKDKKSVRIRVIRVIRVQKLFALMLSRFWTSVFSLTENLVRMYGFRH
jgi:hypothetical protein